MDSTIGRPVGRQVYQQHARRIEMLRSRLEDSRVAASDIGADQSGLGSVCGWVLSGLGDRYVRHDELMAYVGESLALIVRGLHDVADGEQTLTGMVGAPDDESEAMGAPASLSRVMDDVLDAVESREWVEPQLGEAAPVAEFASPADATYAILRAAGLEYATGPGQPLRQVLDDLTGMPDVVARQAATWGAHSADLHRVAADLRHVLDSDFRAPYPHGVRSYLALMAHNVEALLGMAAIAGALGAITKAAGDLILLTRDIVRGLIGDLFARVIVWITAPDVVALPVIAARLAAVVACIWRIHDYINALVTSVANLSRRVEG